MPLYRRAKKAGWDVSPNGSGFVFWRNPEGYLVATHGPGLFAGAQLTKHRATIKKALDEQDARQAALAAIARRKEGDAALAQIGAGLYNGQQAAPVEQVFSHVEDAEPVQAHPYTPVPAAFEAPAVPEVEERMRMARGSDVGPRFKPTFRMVPVADIHIDRIDQGGYQRPVVDDHALNLAVDFTWDKFGQVELSLRDGWLWCLDGQNRLVALEITDRVPDAMKQRVPAMVFTGMSRADEAEYYLSKNTGRKAVHPIHAWKARLVNDPKVQHIEQIVAEHGFRVQAGGQSDYIAAVSRLEQLYDDFGSEKLASTIRALARAYQLQHTIPAVLLNATGLVVGVFDGVDIERLARTLASNTPIGWMAWAKTVTASEKGRQAVWLGRRLTEEYDKKLAPERQLRDFEGAYGLYLSEKLSGRHLSDKAKRRAELASRPRPGSWLRPASVEHE
jgi:hypothetical protein